MRPFYEEDGITIYCGDCLADCPDARDGLGAYLMSALGRVDAVVTDPPYGDTSLRWDKRLDGWAGAAAEITDQLWCFGSMRMFLESGDQFCDWKYAQEIVWEKHNGSGFHADRFKRVHEFAVQWYRGEWGKLHREVQVTMDARKRTARGKARPPHMGVTGARNYETVDGGPRLMRSVLQVRSEHGRAVHPTQKPLGILSPLIRYSVPPGGLVLDPFMGSGSTLLAARQLGRRAIGIEISEEYCEAAVKRLGQRELLTEVPDLELEAGAK